MKTFLITALCCVCLSALTQTPITNFPWTEDFEHDGNIPPGWTKEHVSGNTDASKSWKFQEGTWAINEAHNGNYNAFHPYNDQSSDPSNVNKLITPVLQLRDNSTPCKSKLSFWLLQRQYTENNIDYQDTLMIYYRTSETSSWVLIDTFRDIPIWTNIVLDLPEPSLTYQIAFEGHSNYSTGIGIDDVCVYKFCDAPTNVSVSGETLNSAVISFSSVDGFSEYEYAVVPEGGAPVIAEIRGSIGATGGTISGLSGGTDYDVYVRTVCSCGVGYSLWSEKATFSTPCDAIDEIPFIEGFENDFPPQCWIHKHESGVDTRPWQRVDYGSQYCQSCPDPSLGTHCINHPYCTQADLSAGGATDKLILPPLNLNSGCTPKLTFWHHQKQYEGNQDTLTVYYRKLPNSEWEAEPLAKFISGIGEWKHDTINLRNPSSGYQIAFEGSSDYAYGIFLDEVEVSYCFPPRILPLGANDITGNSVHVSFTAAESGDREWEYAVVPDGGDPDAADIVGVLTATTGTIPGLQPNTRYQLYLRTKCTCGGHSAWSIDKPFTTGCGTFNRIPFYEGFECNGSIPNCWTKNVGGRWVCKQGGYDTSHPTNNAAHSGDYNLYNINTEQNITTYDTIFSPVLDLRSAPVACTLHLSFWYTVSEYNNNHDEIKVLYRKSSNDSWEEITNSACTETTNTWTKKLVALPRDYTPTYQIAFVAMSQYTWGTTIDDVAINYCFEPTDVEVTESTSNSVKFSFTPASTTDNAWECVVVVKDYNYERADTIYQLNTHENCVITGLASGTEYEVYVRTKCPCGDNTHSQWSKPDTFYAECDTIRDFPYLQTFEYKYQYGLPGSSGYYDTNFLQQMCWSQKWEKGYQGDAAAPRQWTSRPGDGREREGFIGPHSGKNNLFHHQMKDGDLYATIHKLISPVFDLTDFTDENPAVLIFFHAQASTEAGQDTLKVYYRTSSNDGWHLLYTYGRNTPDWKQEVITLPHRSATYQIAFDGIANHGYGVALDDVIITTKKPLSVDLLTFATECHNHSVKVFWQTASETNSDKFIVEKSTDGQLFKPLCTVTAAGNSSTMQSYEVYDVDIQGVTYYRLVQVDYDGSTTISDIIVANCRPTDEAVTLTAFPNPFAGTVNVVVNNIDEPFTLEIFDNVGTPVYSRKYVPSSTQFRLSVDLNNLPPAVYNLRVRSETAVAHTRLVKLQ